MALLKIIKLSNKTWKHNSDVDGNFILTKFYAKQEDNEFLLVETYGSKRRKYLISEIEVYDIGGSAEPFTNFDDLFLRLEALKYPAFYIDGEFTFNPESYDLSEFGNAEADKFVKESEVLSSIISTYTDATTPLAGTELALIDDGTGWKKVAVSEFQTDVSGKLDKVSTAGVERAYIINADGSQGTKATSELKDVLEFANLAAFPVTGETSKIYLALDTNKTYRWSGSAYVQIGGSTEVDFFNPYTSDYFIGTIRPNGQGVTGFTLSGLNNSWSASGTLEAFSEISEYTLVGVKSATTSGASCQFTNSGNSTIRTYIVNRINKVIHWQIFRNSDPAPVANARFFVGIINKFGLIGNTNPSTNFNLVGVGADSGDTNIQVIHNDLSGVATKIDLGSNFPANTQNVDTYLSQTFFDIPNAKAYIRLVRLNTGHEVITEITTNLPAMSGGFDLMPYFWRNNGTDALEVKLRIGSFLQGQKIM